MTPPDINDHWPLAELFEPLDDVQFWIKDRSNAYLHANRALLLNYDLEDVSQIRGKTDYDFSPPFLADQFWLDDEQVLEGHRVSNRIELVGGSGDPPRWSVTNKVPLFDKRGRVMGSSGTTRILSNSMPGQDGASGFERVLLHIRDRFQQPLENRELAQVAGLSVRAFERRFKQSFHLTPQAYIRKLRVRMACRALVFTDKPLATVAVECGFADQSHFNHQFRLQLGRTPGDYRAHYKR